MDTGDHAKGGEGRPLAQWPLSPPPPRSGRVVFEHDTLGPRASPGSDQRAGQDRPGSKYLPKPQRSLSLGCFPGRMPFYTPPATLACLATLAYHALDPGMKALVTQGLDLGHL